MQLFNTRCPTLLQLSKPLSLSIYTHHDNEQTKPKEAECSMHWRSDIVSSSRTKANQHCHVCMPALMRDIDG